MSYSSILSHIWMEATANLMDLPSATTTSGMVELVCDFIAGLAGGGILQWPALILLLLVVAVNNKGWDHSSRWMGDFATSNKKANPRHKKTPQRKVASRKPASKKEGQQGRPTVVPKKKKKKIIPATTRRTRKQPSIISSFRKTPSLSLSMGYNNSTQASSLLYYYLGFQFLDHTSGSSMVATSRHTSGSQDNAEAYEVETMAAWVAAVLVFSLLLPKLAVKLKDAWQKHHSRIPASGSRSLVTGTVHACSSTVNSTPKEKTVPSENKNPPPPSPESFKVAHSPERTPAPPPPTQQPRSLPANDDTTTTVQNQKIADLQDLVQEYQAQLSQEKETRKELLQKASSRVHYTQSQLDQATQTIVQLQHELDAKKRGVPSMILEVGQKEGYLQTLQRQLSEEKLLREQADAEIEQLQEQLEEQRESFGRQKEFLSDSVRSTPLRMDSAGEEDTEEDENEEEEEEEILDGTIPTVKSRGLALEEEEEEEEPQETSSPSDNKETALEQANEKIASLETQVQEANQSRDKLREQLVDVNENFGLLEQQLTVFEKHMGQKLAEAAKKAEAAEKRAKEVAAKANAKVEAAEAAKAEAEAAVPKAKEEAAEAAKKAEAEAAKAQEKEEEETHPDPTAREEDDEDMTPANTDNGESADALAAQQWIEEKEQLSNEIVNLQKELSEAKAEVEEKTAKIKVLELAEEGKDSEDDGHIGDIDTRVMEENKELKSAVELWQGKIVDLQQKLEEMESAAKAKAEADKKEWLIEEALKGKEEVALKEKQERIKELEALLKEQEKATEAAQQQQRPSAQIRSVADSWLQGQGEEVESLQRKLEEKNKDIEKLESSLKEFLTSSFQEFQYQPQGSTEFKETKEEIDTLKASLKEHEEEMAFEIEVLNNKLEIARTKLQEKDQEMEAVRSELEAGEQSAQEWVQELAGQIDALKASQKEKDLQTKALLQEKEQEIDALKSDLKSKQETIDSLQKTIQEKEEKEGEIDTLRTSVRSKEGTIETLLKTVQENQEKEEEIDDLKSDLKDKQVTIETLQNTIKEKEDKEKEIGTLTSDLKDKEETIERLQKTIKEKEEELSKATMKNKTTETAQQQVEVVLKKKDKPNNDTGSEKATNVSVNSGGKDQMARDLEFLKDQVQQQQTQIQEDHELRSSLQKRMEGEAKSLRAQVAELQTNLREEQQLHLETILNFRRLTIEREEKEKAAGDSKKKVTMKVGHRNRRESC